MESVLEQIITRSRAALAERKLRRPQSVLARLAAELPPPPDFEAALRQPGLRVIAELKPASPSRGVIRSEFPVAALAAELATAGAAALSVLTEENFFRGSLQNLEIAAETVSIPLLRKDFIDDDYQLYEARVAGASAVLLIAAMLTPSEFSRLHSLAASLGLAVLAEAHTAAELAMVLEHGARIVGINARNLKTFHTDLAVTETLIATVPRDRIAVAESGIATVADLERLHRAGAGAFLVGEVLMREPHPGEKLCELISK